MMFKSHMKLRVKLKIYLYLMTNETSLNQVSQVARQVANRKVVKVNKALQVLEVEYLLRESNKAKRKRK